MSNLKELTKEQHTNAERQSFVKVLMSGKINPEFYATYLWNQRQKYDKLEMFASELGIFDELAEIKRAHHITEDFLELWKTTKEFPPTVTSTFEYLDHVEAIRKDATALMAHVYTLHMGDLSGGQMISKKVPGSGMMYKFSGNTEDLKDRIRKQITDDMAEEAKWVFESATALFKELMELDIEHYLE